MINEKLIISKKTLHKLYFEGLKNLNIDKTNKLITQEDKKIYIARIKIRARCEVNELLNSSYGFQSPDLNIIFINLKDIQDKEKLRNETQHNNNHYTLDELICETYTHECIHSILNELIDFKTSKKYDNIYRKLRDYDIMG